MSTYNTLIKEARLANKFPPPPYLLTDAEFDLRHGLEAFAHLWFIEFTDETELPKEFYNFVDLIEQWNLADLTPIADEDDA